MPESVYAEALAENIGALKDALGISDEQSICLANGIVEILGGSSRFEEAGITPDVLGNGETLADLGIDITDAEIANTARLFDGCSVDVLAVLLDGLEVQRTVPPEVERCVRESVDMVALRGEASRELLGVGGGVNADLARSLLPCLEQLIGTDPEGENTPGEDP